MATISALDYLQSASAPVPPVCVAFGDEPFLKAMVLAQLRGAVLSGDDGEFSRTRFNGRSAELRAVLDELATVALFGAGRRLVIVDEADDFVSLNRAVLEDYAARPSTTGTLVLEVTSWPSNTRLAKALAEVGLAIECKAPTTARLVTWLIAWSRERHGARLARDAAELLVETVGPELGLLDQELAKLAAAGSEAISAKRVEELVGGWRVKTTWDMLDAAAAGNARQALIELDRLLLSGETAVGILGQMGVSLRRFAAATRLVEQAEAEGRRIPLRQALEGAGVKPMPYILRKAEEQLKKLGRQRAGKLYRWVLDADLALKGHSSSPPRARIVLEQLVARMASQLPQAPAGRH